MDKFFFGGEYLNEDTEKYEFHFSTPSPDELPHLACGLKDGLDCYKKLKRHSHMYRVSKDGKRLIIHACSHNGTGAPSTIDLTEKQQELIQKAIDQEEKDQLNQQTMDVLEK